MEGLRLEWFQSILPPVMSPKDGWGGLTVNKVQESITQEFVPILPPEPVSFWPPQPGWYVVIALLLFLMGFIAYKLVQKKRRNAYRKRALEEHEKLSVLTYHPKLIPQLNTLLKITALQAGFPRAKIAGLTGREWIDFLEQTAMDNQFTSSQSRLLSLGSYASMEQVKVDSGEWNQILFLTEHWILKHKIKKDMV